ncbi:unnamed protein product [Arctia plantaginis]|uniref:Uncharacterized protein n=1 Tax=Arctia plantaginis TaxID=874455 RepID=A0A8S1AA71_ARCPL|nr:unnamed protein product [Arctia plantaginis]
MAFSEQLRHRSEVIQPVGKKRLVLGLSPVADASACRARPSVDAETLRAQVSTTPSVPIHSDRSSRAERSTHTLALGEPSAVAPVPPSAMDHDEDRSLSLGTEVSASVPPPSPLTGCYLLAVIGEPHTHEHKEIILQRLVKGKFSRH